MSKLRLQKNRSGFSLIELVIYFSMLSVLTIVVISSLMSLFKTYSVIKLQQEIETSAIQVLDKMTRDIRDASGVVNAQSSFGVPEGAVALSVTTGTITDTYRYYVASSSVKFSKNDVYVGDLTSGSVSVNSLRAYEILGTSTHAIKLELSLQAVPRYGTSTIIKNFYTTVQLRN